MTKRTPAEVYRQLLAAGFPPELALTMTAVAGAESGYDDAAIGDVALQDATWGPSYGLWQIRTLKRDTGRGGPRDITALTGDPAAQARAAWQISRHGADLSPWTVYTSGRYRDFLAQAQAAAGGGITLAGLPGLPAPGDVLAGVRAVALEGVFVLLGLALLGAGVYQAVAPRLNRAASSAGRAVKAVI
jgi:hypothetical protein